MPPWLWFWLATFTLSLPWIFGEVDRTVKFVLRANQWSHRMMETDPVMAAVDVLTYPGALVDLLPPAALLLGLGMVLAPGARCRLVERRYGLGPMPAGVAEAGEIEAFVRRHAPAVELRWNLVRGREMAMVYPASYRRGRLGVFGGVVRLWRNDRAAAEAVLLHEVAHLRHGDALIMGAGSFFSFLARYTVLGLLVCLVVPLAIAMIIQTIHTHSEMSRIAAETERMIEELMKLGIPRPPDAPVYRPSELILKNAGLFVTGMAGLVPTVLLSMLRFMVMPLAAIWTAELYADSYVVERQGSSAALERGLGVLQRPVRWWRWLLFRLSHPPVRLRRWFVKTGAGRANWLLLMFPAAYLAKLVVLWGMVASVSLGVKLDVHLLENTRTYFATLAPVVIAAGVLVLAWPA
ncbi:MAG TPA: hypothetical protein VFS20_14370, partial [Longimicrobium sp.]|nr:hypothetical protein [Longimicrobium sp.]